MKTAMTKDEFKQAYENLYKMEQVPFHEIKRGDPPREVKEIVGAVTSNGSMIMLRSFLPDGVDVLMLRPLPDGRCSHLGFGLTKEGAEKLMDVLVSVL